ncbi:MAG: transposase [Bdellovibrio sp.]
MRAPLEGMQAFAGYVKNHKQRILNSIKTGLSSAISEGINNKISVIKRMAYGYRTALVKKFAT